MPTEELFVDQSNVDDPKPKRLPVPSGEQETKLKLRFTAPAQLTHKMKLPLSEDYTITMNLMFPKPREQQETTQT